MRNLTRRLLIATLTFSTGLSSAWLVRYYGGHKDAQTRRPSVAPVTDASLISFEGTLLKSSPHFGAACGDLYIHQVAKYRVEKVLAGEYTGDEIVVDHPACGGDVFQHIPAGSRVQVTVSARLGYYVITMHPGIRDKEHPKVFYIAEDAPLKMANDR